MPKAIAVCDHVQLFREGVARVLDGTRFQVIHSVRSLAEIVTDPTKKSEVALILIGVSDDLSLDNTLQLIGELTESDPFTVVLTTSPTCALIRAAISSRVRAVLSKDISGEILSSALELVLLGHKFFPAYDDECITVVGSGPAMTVSDVSRARATELLQIRLPVFGDDDIQLSEREEQILCRLVAGAPNKTIARDLMITDATVKVHIKGLLRKLRVINRTQAAIWGVNHGFGEEKHSNKRVNGVVASLNGIHVSS